MRKHFSRLGMAYFLGGVIIFVLQWIVGAVIRAVRPDWLSNVSVALICSTVPMYLVGMPAMAWLVKRIPGNEPVAGRKMRGREFFAAFSICYAILYLSNLVGLMMTGVIGLIKGSSVVNEMAWLAENTNPVVLFVFTVLCAPVAEEFLFRKLIVDRTVRFGEKTSIILSGLMFGLFHGNLNQFVYAFTLGMFLAFIYIKTGRIKYTIWLHMIINFLGGVAGMVMLNLTHYGEVMEELALYGNAPVMMLKTISGNIGGLVVMSVYSCLLLALVITGIVLFCVNRKKFWVSDHAAECRAEGEGFLTALWNPGMILYIVFWVVMIVRQLFAG